MTRSHITANELKKAADHIAETKGKSGYYHWKIPNKYHKDISIVLDWVSIFDWENGYDRNGSFKDKYHDGIRRLAFKVGYQPDDTSEYYDYHIDLDHEYWQYGIYETTDFKALAKMINQHVDEKIEHWKLVSSE